MSLIIAGTLVPPLILLAAAVLLVTRRPGRDHTAGRPLVAIGAALVIGAVLIAAAAASIN